MGSADYERLKSLGICLRCRRADARPGKINCEDCAAEASAKRKAQRDAYRAAGGCIQCGRPRVAGGSRCAKHRLKHRQESKRLKEKRKAECRCHICGGEIEFAREGHLACQRCGDRRKRQAVARRRAASAKIDGA